MNMKFSTLLTMGLLATSSLCSSAWAQAAAPITINGIELEQAKDPDGTNVKTWAAGPYIVVADNGTPGLDAGDVLLKVTLDEATGTLSYAGYEWLGSGADVDLDLTELTWTFNEDVATDVADATKKNYRYTLQNIGLGTYLTFTNGNASAETDPAKSKYDLDKKQLVYFSAESSDLCTTQFTQAANEQLFLYTATASGNAIKIDATGVTLDPTASNLVLYKLKTQTLDNKEAAEAMNATMAGEGFSFEFAPEKDLDWANDVLSDVKLKAFYVAGNINIDQNNDMKIPAGVYFATSYPEELIGTDVIADPNLFKQCTFIAIDPTGNYDIHESDRKNGLGYELTTVQGSAMNFYQGGDNNGNFSHAEEVFVGNACFTVEVPNAVTAPEAYNIKARNIHVFVTDKDNADKKHVTKSGLYIGCIADQQKNYLVTTTVADALDFATTNSTLLDGDDLVKFLQKEDAPSVYTIRFVSGEKKETASEYEQYLTVAKSAANVLELASTVDFDEADPMYQFVVTGVDKTNKTITLANRQTTADFTVSLYENEDGVYTILPAAGCKDNVFVEYINGTAGNNSKDEIVTFESVNLANTKIVLTPYTVEDKFATFVNRTDNMGLVQFELALNSDVAPAFYVGATRNDDGEMEEDELLAYVDGENMTQFELIKSKNPVNVLNNYIYLDGKRVRTSTERDTVAYYTYAIKAFDDEIDNYYLGAARSKYNLTEDGTDEFIIKKNLDGSVALIVASQSGGLVSGTLAFVGANDITKDEQAAWKNAFNYDLTNKINKGLKTFMVDETPAVSLEVVPQHVSFALTRGGFLTNKDNDAFQNIATEAGEDLTFWVDTVKSDNNIPSFYITKAGHFLYNAADSAEYYNARGNYRFNLENQKDEDAKLIFKAGELVSSDTLRTVVDGKSVLVAEKDNAPKKIKGGLNNFQFQIIKAEDGSDEYVIRQGRTDYVQMINSYFYLSADKNTAVRFEIEKQATPTANEGVEVSEVKVIAGNGQITIAGAQGKKVVVSNILGQTVANTVVASDNATIAAPAGVVVVAVEGEAAVKAIVK
ncbi:DUF6383 domain-containing protein [Parabacteroides johnsonii]